MRWMILIAMILMPMSSFAAAQNIAVAIDGMTCEECVSKVKEKLAKVDGVEKTSVNVILNKKTATLRVANADAKTMTAIKDAVKSAGYTVVGEPKMENNAIKN